MRLLFFLVLLPMQILSQELSGIWTGVLQTNGVDLPYEIAIRNDNGNLSGYSLTIFNIDGVENVGIKSIHLKDKHGSIFIEDEKLIYNNYVTTSRKVKLIGEMVLRMQDTVMTLKGIFRTRSLDFREQNSTSYSGTITLRKTNSPQETKLVSTLEEMNLLNTLAFKQEEKAPKPEIQKDIAAAPVKPAKPSRKKRQPADEAKKEKTPPPPVVVAENKKPVTDTVAAAADLATRETEIIQNVFFKSDSLVLKLYDHGVIDGDTVSVVLNGKVIAARQGLKGKAIISVIHMTPELGDSLLLVMYAESLGTIPPNTGVLVVLDGDDRYEIRFQGTKQKSSAIRLTRKRR